ncbi:AAA family ATPase [Acetobacteraceae bacterium KSS8]|uniref:AAA family ATPase n=1 Tax=Endosaccharibacter trunci TaxID=2812733 RepID=A0ABT1W3T0_9PROT|nr:AAA family ATPase [Acetobacteraceae bacterium KSS8]
MPENAGHPFTVPAIAAEPLDLEFTRPVTIFVGVNGSGKSTLLEAIAALSGFGGDGGNRNYRDSTTVAEERLSQALRASWKPKVSRGFYTRAETIMGLISRIDAFDAQVDYGGRSLTTRSHGEGYLQIFRNRIEGGSGLFVLDEPEAALSPALQIEFLRMIRRAERREDTQFIIATHSPLLMAYPGTTLLHMTDFGIIERPFERTDHFRLLREFYRDPGAFMSSIFDE